MGKEPEVITFKEFVERNKNIPFEELCKMVLECKNCGHKDLLKNFIKERKPDWSDIQPAIDPSYPYKPKPYKPKPWHPNINPWKRYRVQNKQKMSSLVIDHKDYEDLFFCPACKSSLVVLCEEFNKNNLLRSLEEHHKV